MTRNTLNCSARLFEREGTNAVTIAASELDVSAMFRGYGQQPPDEIAALVHDASAVYPLLTRYRRRGAVTRSWSRSAANARSTLPSEITWRCISVSQAATTLL